MVIEKTPKKTIQHLFLVALVLSALGRSSFALQLPTSQSRQKAHSPRDPSSSSSSSAPSSLLIAHHPSSWIHSFNRAQVRNSATYNSDVKSKGKGNGINRQKLWYRDRDAADEQMTQPGTTDQSLQQIPQHQTNAGDPLMKSQKQDSSTANDATAPSLRIQETASLNLLNTGAVDLSMIKSICFSQAMAFALAFTVAFLVFLWNFGPGECLSADFWNSIHWNTWNPDHDIRFHGHYQEASFRSLLDWQVTPWRLILGILASLPLIGMETMVEESEHHDASHVNLSITNTVLSLFGRRRLPTNQFNTVAATDGIDSTIRSNAIQVAFFSLGISFLSAMSEEIIFRGLLPAIIVLYTHSIPAALLGQSLLFGMGQLRQHSSKSDNRVFCALHAAIALWYGVVYLATSGDILPVILAHVFYESHVFVETWTRINHQMEYTEEQLLTNPISSQAPSLPSDLRQQQQLAGDDVELLQIQRETGVSLAPETFASCRRFFYAFDYDHQGSLSLSDVQRAVAYSCLHDAVIPSESLVSRLFDQTLEERKTKQDHQAIESSDYNESVHRSLPLEDNRLYLSEFLRLLFTLKSKAQNNQVVA